MIINRQIYSDRNQKSLYCWERRRLIVTGKGQKATSLGDGNVLYPNLGSTYTTVHIWLKLMKLAHFNVCKLYFKTHRER